MYDSEIRHLRVSVWVVESLPLVFKGENIKRTIQTISIIAKLQKQLNRNHISKNSHLALVLGL